MRLLIIDTYYPEFVKDLYAEDPSLADLPYEMQRDRLFATGFGVSDAYPFYLRALGYDAQGVICNVDPLQDRWACEHGLTLSENIHERRRQIVAAQINEFQPDVLYVFEWCPLGDAFLRDMRDRARLIVGQIASPLPANRTFAAYDLMISSWPPIVDYFRSLGIGGESLRLGFDPRVAERMNRPIEKTYDVTFVGGFAPSHPDRVTWLERLLREVDVTVFGYGLERVPPESSIHAHHGGAVWGWKMYDVLRRSRVTLNRHAWIDVRGNVVTRLATNMRLYEATGVGTCLLTEQKENLYELFVPHGEVAVYQNDEDCVTEVKRLLQEDARREAIAAAGMKRTLSEHGYDLRMGELVELLRPYLHRSRGSPRRERYSVSRGST